jgi:hypothetical protein
MGAYKFWEEQVNQYMIKLHGVGIDDIPDMPYRDWWDDGWTIDDAVTEAIRIVNSGEWL